MTSIDGMVRAFVLVAGAARGIPAGARRTTMIAPFRRSCDGAATTVTVATMAAVVLVHLPSTCVIGNRDRAD